MANEWLRLSPIPTFLVIKCYYQQLSLIYFINDPFVIYVMLCTVYIVITVPYPSIFNSLRVQNQSRVESVRSSWSHYYWWLWSTVMVAIIVPIRFLFGSYSVLIRFLLNIYQGSYCIERGEGQHRTVLTTHSSRSVRAWLHLSCTLHLSPIPTFLVKCQNSQPIISVPNKVT